MKVIVALVAAVGIVAAVSVPLARYAAKQRDEAVAIDVLHRVHSAQQAFRAREAGYATDVASLTTPCPSISEALPPSVLSRLERAGYAFELRLAAGATPTGRDCHGRVVASDYYSAAMPASSSTAGQQAFAGRADGRFYLFFDGIAPRESEMSSGLATPLAERETFRIP